jgi:hypothetical protein
VPVVLSPHRRSPAPTPILLFLGAVLTHGRRTVTSRAAADGIAEGREIQPLGDHAAVGARPDLGAENPGHGLMAGNGNALRRSHVGVKDGLHRTHTLFRSADRLSSGSVRRAEDPDEPKKRRPAATGEYLSLCFEVDVDDADAVGGTGRLIRDFGSRFQKPLVDNWNLRIADTQQEREQRPCSARRH